MHHHVRNIPLDSPVSSLCWSGNTLIDWAGGNRVIDFNGGANLRQRIWSYRFDAAVQSPSGRYAAIYEQTGTKALLLERGELIRELNRSYYCANAYEYPIGFLTHPDGRELIAHCPEEYDQLEIDDAATGERLTSHRDRNPVDFFHSRLAVSPDNRRLLSAGWQWHPINMVSTWSIAEALADGRALDAVGSPYRFVDAEVNDAVFVDSERLLLSSSPDAENFGNNDSPLRAGTLSVFNLQNDTFESTATLEETTGPMLWLGNDLVVGLYEHPKIINVRTGQVVFRLTEVATGKRSGCIFDRSNSLPKLALDPPHRRLAVAHPDRITVVEFPQNP